MQKSRRNPVLGISGGDPSRPPSRPPSWRPDRVRNFFDGFSPSSIQWTGKRGRQTTAMGRKGRCMLGPQIKSGFGAAPPHPLLNSRLESRLDSRSENMLRRIVRPSRPSLLRRSLPLCMGSNLDNLMHVFSSILQPCLYPL